MSSEKFCLKWNDFESNITSAFREIKEEKDFFDVTIACGDDQVQAHKVILSACSPFFKNLLRRNQHPHPLLYLKGISFSGIQSVLNFMYHGEANIAQEDLNTFLSVAEELKVKGLTQNQSQQGSSSKPTQSAPKTKPQSNPVKTTSRSFQAVEEDDEIQEVDSQMIKLEQGEASKQADLQVAQFDEQEQYFEDYDESYSEDFMTVTDSNTVVEKGLSHEQLDQYICENSYRDEINKKWCCGLCGQSAILKSDISRHIESKHAIIPDLQCNICGKPAKTRDTLRRHMSKFHATSDGVL